MAKKFETSKLMVMRKDDLTLRKLASELLSHRDITKSQLLHHNIDEDGENKNLNRGIVSLSFLVQFFLKRFTLPFAIGKKIEQLLNSNIQDDNSKKYISIVGHLDTRTELDKDIKVEDGRYLAALSMMASKLAYENQSVVNNVVSHQWKMELEDFYDGLYNEYQKAFATQAFIFRDETPKYETTIVIAFRGTSPFEAEDWCTDINLSWCKIEGMPGKVHLGFMTALGLKKLYPDRDRDSYQGYWPKNIDHQNPKFPLAYYTIRDKLKQILKTENNKKIKFVVTGHSLGGALATLFPAILALHEEVELLERFEAIYTFGQPRVGNEKFGNFMEENLRKYNIKYYRIVYGCDIVPTLPWDNAFMRFKHFGTGIQFNSLYQGKIIEEEESGDKWKDERKGILGKGFGLLRGTTKRIVDATLNVANAEWELIRGFIIEFTAGPQNREGWLLIVSRITGILTPRLIAHNPYDYVNATRFASPDLFLA